MLRLAARLAKILGSGRLDRSRPARRRVRPGLACESLEPRELLSGGGRGVDYTLMGGQWDDSRTITYSVAPDGVSWDQGTNNINTSLNGEYGGAGWQTLIAQALQTWAAVTNLNFTQVGDGNYAFNTTGASQGDPRFGDIRLGGYNLGTTSTIAQTYGPPPNGQTAAGDVELNTGFNFTPGSHYDLETVLLHELGHSLGLGESPQPSSVMYTYYEGVRQSLSSYDIEGIQSIYGARRPDAYQGAGLATSAATALNLTPVLNPAEQGALAGLSLQSIGDVEYFSVVAPNVTGSTFDVAAIAQGFSLLSPKISVIDPSTGATLVTNSNPNADGNVALASVPGVQANHRYLIAVTGATDDDFSVGSYGLQLGFFGGQSNAPPPDGYAYNNTFANPTDLGTNTQPTLGNLTLPSALNYQLFSFETTKTGLVQVATLGADVVVGNASGQVVVEGSGALSFNSTQVGRYYLILLSPNGAPVSNYAFAVRTPVIGPSVVASSLTPPTPVATTIEVDSTADADVDVVTPTTPVKKTVPPVPVPASVLRV
jgi:hypothetical protein